MVYRLLMTLLLIWPSCTIATRDAQTLTGYLVAQAEAHLDPAAGKAVIILKRSEDYFGVAPAYRLTVYADGRVAYVGEKNVRVKGAARGRISQKDLQRLIEKIEEIKFFSLRDRYGAGEGCPFYLYDAASVYIQVELGGKQKAVSHDLGCVEEGGMRAFPAGLYKLEELIDATVKSSQWVK